MIETDYYILTHDQYYSAKQDAEKFDVSVDYFLLEFCSIEGDYVTYD